MTYQDAFLKSKTLPGGSQCAQRWEIIQNHLPQNGLMLDIASDLGYFSVRSALARPGLAVVSLESDEALIRFQKKIIASHRLERVCLLQGRIHSVPVRQWALRADWFDLTLILSGFYSFDKPAQMIQDFSAMSGKMIVELPESEAIGNPVEWFGKQTGRPCSLIGRFRHPACDEMSHLILIEGETKRKVPIKTWNPGLKLTHNPALEFTAREGKFYERGRDEQPIDCPVGVNLSSLMKTGQLIWPRAASWMRLAQKTLRSSPFPLDLFSHTLLWSAQGLHLACADTTQADDTAEKEWVHQRKLHRNYEERFLKNCLRAWERNETAAASSAVNRIPRREAILSAPAKLLKRLTRKSLPQAQRLRLKKNLGVRS